MSYVGNKFAALRSETCSYLIVDGDENKERRRKTKCVTKRKPKFKDYENSLQIIQHEKEIKYLEKNKLAVDSLKETINNS